MGWEILLLGANDLGQNYAVARMPVIDWQLGDIVRKLRRQLQIANQEALAKDAAGFNKQVVNWIEQGRASVARDKVEAVSRALGFSATQLDEMAKRMRDVCDEVAADEALGKTPTGQSPQTDTSDAALARARRTSDHGTEVGRVSDQHLTDLEAIYRATTRGLDDQARKALVDELELTAERFKQRLREKETKKASGE